MTRMTKEIDHDERAFGWGDEVFFPRDIPKDLLNDALALHRTESAQIVRLFLVDECKKRGLEHFIKPTQADSRK